MPDATVIAARLYASRHPGYHLVQAVEAAVPVTAATIDMLIQERKELPLIEEFVLRLSAQGIITISEMALVLGIDEAVVSESVARQMSAENVDYRPGSTGAERVVLLTAAGRRAVTDAVAITPKRTTQQWPFDRLTWQATSYTKDDLVSRDDAKKAGLILLPGLRTHDITPDEVPPRSLNALLDNARQTDSPSDIQVLTVDAITRQRRMFLPVVLLIFENVEHDDVRYNIVLDDLVSDPHDLGLANAGTHRIDIQVEPPIGEPALTADLQQQRIGHDIVLALHRRAGADETTGRPGEAADKHVDASAARAELASFTVRSVPAFEHRELLEAALRTTQRRFLLIAPSVRKLVLDGGFMTDLDAMLRRRGITAHIAYPAAGEHDPKALKQLQDVATQRANLTVTPIDGTASPVLIYDDVWINTNFSWLSFRGDPTRTYRREEGTLVRIADRTNEEYERHLAQINQQ